MKTAYIFHDAFCDPTSDWYPWMKTTLEAIGYVVVVPKFPTPAGQSYDSWKVVMKNYLDKFDAETLFIGHGVGGTFALRLAEELSLQIHGLFLVASYAQPIGHIGYDRVNESFTKHDFDWKKIQNNTLTIKVFAGENDPFVHAEATENLAKNLDTTTIVIPAGEHINKASGFTQCIPLVQGIKEGLGEIEKSMVVETTTTNVTEETEIVRAADANSFAVKQERVAPTEEKIFGSEAPVRRRSTNWRTYHVPRHDHSCKFKRRACYLITVRKSPQRRSREENKCSTKSSQWIVYGRNSCITSSYYRYRSTPCSSFCTSTKK
jgi:predicted alpha/beta hydrolase family esterase